VKEELPILFFTSDGSIQEKVQILLHQLFGFDEKGLAKTKYKAGNFKHGAITIFSRIKFDRSLYKKYSIGDWFGLLVHEQVHREDIVCHPQGGMGFYFSYFLGWIQAGFSYRMNEYEVKAYDKEKIARQMWNAHSTLLLEMINKEIDLKVLRELKTVLNR